MCRSLGNSSKEVAPVCSALVTLFSRSDPVQKIELALKNYTLSRVFVLWHHWHVFGFWEEGRRKKLKVEGWRFVQQTSTLFTVCVCAYPSVQLSVGGGEFLRSAMLGIFPQKQNEGVSVTSETTCGFPPWPCFKMSYNPGHPSPRCASSLKMQNVQSIALNLENATT